MLLHDGMKVGHSWFPAVQSAGVYQHAKTMFLCPAEEAGRLPASRCPIAAAFQQGCRAWHDGSPPKCLSVARTEAAPVQPLTDAMQSCESLKDNLACGLSRFRCVRRPAELVSATLTALSKIALAEAQTVTAARAAAICATPALVASIHVGIAGASTTA